MAKKKQSKKEENTSEKDESEPSDEKLDKSSEENEKKSEESEEEQGDIDNKTTEADSSEAEDSETKSEEDKKAEEEEEKPSELSKEDVIKILKTFSGVGQVMAERIFDAGFDSREKIQAISIEDLKKISGIGQALAESIANGMENAIKEHDKPPKEEIKKTGPGITDKAVGFIKGTFSKITGFFKGKSPKPKAKDGEEGANKLESTESESKDKLDDIKTEEALKEKFYPEVEAPETGSELEVKHDPVTVESSDAEPTIETTTVTMTEPELKAEAEPELETESEPEPEPTPELEVTPAPDMSSVITEPLKEPEVNLKDSSGLFMWFESMPNLRTETGKLLFKAGYNNLLELKEAVVEDLILVKGIEQYEAKIIFEELRKID